MKLHCGKCKGPVVQIEQRIICANWIECDGAGTIDADAIGKALIESLQKATAAFKAIGEALEAFKELHPYNDLAISECEARLIQAPAIRLAELSEWNMPLEFIMWIVERLPDSIRLRFSEMIQA